MTTQLVWSHLANRPKRVVIPCEAAKAIAGFWMAASGYVPSRAAHHGLAVLEPVSHDAPWLVFTEQLDAPGATGEVLEEPLALVSDDLDADVSVLQRFGAQVLSEKTADGRRRLTCTDPEGHLFVLSEPDDEGSL